MTSPPDASPTTATAPRPPVRIIRPRAGWRFWVVAGVWCTLVAAVVLGFQTFGMMLGIGVGQALGATTTPDDWTEVWWRWVGIVIGVGIAAIGAIVMRRWVALVLALLLLVVCGFLAGGLADEVRPAVTPVVDVDPDPLPCACYSGSVCDCPGG